jgi:hypothetical protein
MLGNNCFNLNTCFFYILFCCVITVFKCNDIDVRTCCQDPYFTVTRKQIDAGKHTQHAGYMKKNRGMLGKDWELGNYWGSEE